MQKRDAIRRLGAALMISVIPGLPIAMGQEANGQAGSEVDRAVQEIIVTAQKREQNLQDVPIVVTAIPQQLLQDTGVRDIKDLALVAPGLTVTSTTSETATTARIRGIGTVGDNPGLESSVGVVIDGVYRPRNGVGFGDLGELERIEILKGPQGTLFGKNTSAGVINIITQQPSFDFGVNGELSIGNLGMREGSGSITGPIIGDTLAGRLHVAARERDGLYDVNTGAGPRTLDEDANRDFYTVRGQLLFRPAETLDVRLIADYTDRDESCCAATHFNASSAAAVIDALAPDSGVANPADPFARRAYMNRPTDQKIEDQGISAEINWDLSALGDATLTSLTAWRNWESLTGQDADFSTADILYRRPDGNYANDFHQVSQEIRLAGATERVNWLVGAFFAREDLDSTQEVVFGSAFEPYVGLLVSGGLVQAGLRNAPSPAFVSQLTGLPFGASYVPGSSMLDRFAQESDSYALFTNNSIAFTEALELTVGLRYTSEEKTLDSHYRNLGGNGAGCAASRTRLNTIRQTIAPVQALQPLLAAYYGVACLPYGDPVFNDFSSSQKIDESEWSGTVKLAYRFSDQVMSYVSYARGYKAGGFNLDRERITTNPASPATAADPDTSFAPELVDSYELGAKSNWLDDQLLVNAALFYQEYEDFQLNTFTGINYAVASIPKVISRGVDLDFVYMPMRSLSLQGGVTYGDTTYGKFTPGPGIAAQLPGNRMSFAPLWSTSLSATYEQPIGANFLWRANVGAKRTSSYNTGSDVNPLKEQEALTLVNARLGFGSSSRNWMVEAWGQNLTDEEYYQVIFDAPIQPGGLNAFLGMPRTYGVTLRVSF